MNGTSEPRAGNPTTLAPVTAVIYVWKTWTRSGPWQVGVEWLTGTGPRDRAFMDGDMFTEMLKQHSHVEETRNIIKSTLANGGEFNSPGADKNGYRLSGIEGVPKYLDDYSSLATGGATGNLAVTYLGSYTLTYR